MKQTAVEWLYEVFYSTDTFKQAEVLKKALEMEKEQIMRTAWHCHIEGVKQGSKTSQEYIQYAEQYYNETFKSETIVTEYRDGSIDVETFKSE